VGDDVDNWTENSIRKLFKLDGTSPALACVFDGILCVTATLFDSTLTIRLRYRRERRR
jgi:hypothetical protein